MVDGPTIAWFHCFSGISGTAAIGALVDVGADLDEVRALCDRLPVHGWELDAEPVMRGGLAATRIHIRLEATSVVRTAAHVGAMVDEARLPDRLRSRAVSALSALAHAEAVVQRRQGDHTALHDLLGMEALLEVVGTCAALEVLDVTDVAVSEVAHGRGMVRRAGGALHPVPSPATVELLREAPTRGLDIPTELTTPVGAALMSTLASSWGPMPAVRVRSSGFGAGPSELGDRPHATQVVLGTRTSEPVPGHPVMLLEANLDDATGETLAHTMRALVDAGALDAWVTPVVMSRGRPGHVLSALADTALAEQVAGVITAETGALDIRGQRFERWPTARRVDDVDVEGRRIRVQVSAGRVKVEHDDAARAAGQIGKSAREVVSLAEEAWRRDGPDLIEVAPLNPVEDDPGDDDGPVGAPPDIA
ncbi:MAG: LarC family nickel insertion protein [Actinomycetota bacterium]